MTETKIPMQIFTSYEALTQYYGDRDDCELGLYVSDNELLVGHVPTAYSFNPQYFTGYNELLPDYAPPSVIDYTVTAESNNSTYGYVTGAGTYPQHSEITLNAYAYNGYKFDKWSNDVETAAYTFAVEENVDLTAIFVDNTYTVTISAEENRGTVTGAGVYIAGSSVTVTATPKSGYYFSAWTYLNSPVVLSTDPEYTFTLNKDTDLFAAFADLYNVIATPNNVNYGSTTGSGQYRKGTSVTVTATAEDGYRFVNWTQSGTEVSTSANYTFTLEDFWTELVANFEPNTANINISANNPTYGSVDAAGSTIIGDNYTVMAEANTGYVFVNWTENGTEVSTSTNYTFTVTGDRTLVANFEVNPLSEPFYVENINNANETLTITGDTENAPILTIEYSTDKQTWNSLGTTSTTALTRTIAPGEKLYLRCNTGGWAVSGGRNIITGVSKVGGNIMSLLYGTNFTGNETTFTNSYPQIPFSNLFKGNNKLKTAADLLLPVMNLLTANVSGVYRSMFMNCTSLTAAPKLPATQLVNGCYQEMFYGCTSLTTAPDLPATTLQTDCYRQMFYKMFGSMNVNYVKCLGTTFNSNSTSDWLGSCPATGTFVKAAGVTWPEGTSGIPSGWTVVEV